ncbi:MAG: DRTGG domain-containing protein [Anaerolineae bacterium]
MLLEKVLSVLDAKPVSHEMDPTLYVEEGAAADLMSDVLAISHTDALLMTGLTNPQVIRTAEMADIKAVVFVRGKYPPPETITLAEEKGIPLLSSPYTMYESCGRLYQAGLRGEKISDMAAERWRQAFEED